VTVGDEAQVSRPRMSMEKRAELGLEAWRLKDQGMGSRSISKRFRDRGDDVSHTTVLVLIKEAQEAAEYLDLIGPAETRAQQLGYLDGAIERTQTAIENGEVEFHKGMQLMVQLLKLQKEISGSAMPTRLQVEDTRPGVLPSSPTLAAFAAAIDKHDREKNEIQKTDGLAEFDQ
jgi:hypothetical protein